MEHKPICKVHRYGEPDHQGYVTCWDCGDTFNLAEDNDDDEDYERDYVDYGDDDEREYPQRYADSNDDDPLY